MSLEEKKITSYRDNIKSLSDYPSDDGIGPEELKAMFDGRGDKELKSAINGIITELIAQTGAAQIGSAEGNVQRELDLKADKENAEVIGSLEVSTDNGEGMVKILPAEYGDKAEIKISDATGICASLAMDFDGKLTVSYGSEYIEEKEAEGEVYTTLTHPKLDLTEAELTNDEMRVVRKNIGLSNVDNTADEDKPISKAVRDALIRKLSEENPNIIGTINLDGAKIYNTGDEVVIYRPMVNIAPESTLKIGADLNFNGKMVYHEGNLVDLTAAGIVLDDMTKLTVRNNIGVTEIVGDIETALDSILAIQASLIGGDAA